MLMLVPVIDNALSDLSLEWRARFAVLEHEQQTLYRRIPMRMHETHRQQVHLDQLMSLDFGRPTPAC